MKVASSRWNKENLIAALSIAGLFAHLVLRWGPFAAPEWMLYPLYAVLVLGGIPLVFELLQKASRGQFGSDLLAGVSIVTSIILQEYLAGSLVVLMLSGGNALENYAVESASSVLRALAKRLPRIAHKKTGTTIDDVDSATVQPGDVLVIYPHEICPVDGVVIEGHGSMDESYLTGEPFVISKTPGSLVISGAVNSDSVVTIKATKRAEDSRYAKILAVMKAAEENKPSIRRLGDFLGAWYTPLALAIAGFAWYFSGSSIRFLSVLVVATPCPLLIAIPVSIIGSISLAARRGIIIRDPSVLETVATCSTVILDKTGTLTYGEPTLTDIWSAPGFDETQALTLAASLERYSKHPLAIAILAAAEDRGIKLLEAMSISEPPGQGLVGVVQGQTVELTGRKHLARQSIDISAAPPTAAGLECVILIEGKLAGILRFHDGPRADSRPFVAHLGDRHGIKRIMLVSGDRESEVRYLADQVGITEVHASKSPEEKVEIVRNETNKARTIFLGDGINDAPALLTATVGIALGQQHEVTSEAADVVVLDSSLSHVDEFFHIGERMRAIALQSAVGGMVSSVCGMIFAALGHLPPVAGALTQELIDVFAIANALRAAWPPRTLIDFKE